VGKDECERPNNPAIPRRKIRAYIAHTAAFADPHTEIELAETIGKMYSGFVHGAAPFILDLYGGWPARFHLNGMVGTPRIDEHLRDSWNYYYRSLLSFIGAAKAFGDAELLRLLQGSVADFERLSGKT